MLAWISAPVLFWLKIISFCITSALALFGFTNKATTKWTRGEHVTFWALIVLLIIGVSSQFLEYAQKLDKDRKDAIAATSLNEKSEELLGNVQTLLTNNSKILGGVGGLLTTTTESLNAEKKTDEDTNATLRNVKRNMEPVGDKITVKYKIIVPLDPLEKTMLRMSIADLRIKHPKSENEFGWEGDDTIIPAYGDYVLFGARSPIIPTFDERIPTYMKQPQFEIVIQDEKPRLPQNPRELVERSIDTSARYAYDQVATENSVPRNLTNVNVGWIHDPVGKGVLITDSAITYFRGGDHRGDLLSALDFGGKYLVLHSKFGDDYIACGITVTIGTRSIQVSRDKFGKSGSDYFYRLPNSMSQTPQEAANGNESEWNCVKEWLEGSTK